MNERSNLTTVLLLLMLLLIIGGTLAIISATNDEADLQIDACLAEGGTPIIVSYQYTHEMKACMKETP